MYHYNYILIKLKSHSLHMLYLGGLELGRVYFRYMKDLPDAVKSRAIQFAENTHHLMQLRNLRFLLPYSRTQ